MGFDFTFGLKKPFEGVTRIFEKKNVQQIARIGRKISHKTTEVLGKVDRIAGVVAQIGQGTPVQFIAGAVQQGAKTAKTGIEIGKDVGRAIEHNDASSAYKAKSRVPNLMSSAAQTSADIEAAAMFV